jgi:hypothetical protein
VTILDIICTGRLCGWYLRHHDIIFMGDHWDLDDEEEDGSPVDGGEGVLHGGQGVVRDITANYLMRSPYTDNISVVIKKEAT